MSAALCQSPAHAWFMNNLPEIQSRSQACLSRLQGDRREEAMAEVVGAVFKASVHAQRRGVLARITPYHAVVYAVKQFRQGRRMAGYSSTDVMAEATQLKGRCKVVSLSSINSEELNKGRPLPLAETLADPRQDHNPLEHVRQNMDYPAILRKERVSRKARKVFNMVADDRSCGQGNRIAMAMRMSPARVSQIKDELAQALRRHDYAPA